MYISHMQDYLALCTIVFNELLCCRSDKYFIIMKIFGLGDTPSCVFRGTTSTFYKQQLPSQISHFFYIYVQQCIYAYTLLIFIYLFYFHACRVVKYISYAGARTI